MNNIDLIRCSWCSIIYEDNEYIGENHLAFCSIIGEDEKMSDDADPDDWDRWLKCPNCGNLDLEYSFGDLYLDRLITNLKDEYRT